MYHEELSAFRNELEYRNYSPRTIESYSRCLRGYFDYLLTRFGEGEKLSVRQYSEDRLKEFLLMKKRRGLASQSISLYLNAVKFYYLQVVKINKKIEVGYPRKTNKLPVVLSRNEIRHLRYKTLNLKHRTLICLAYGAGLRLSEVVDLRIRDINWEEKVIWVRQG